ncbi:hypothetical protein EDB92DRAFT_1954000 [Lactarius akahatsu]|uniref:CCHC-type domain-containing protein n=1 Tax=Lactarius akahatsu TaxID=416441 RepID=A0AAD4Q8N0_9AGAM|nr:hypothetical protein EDB92DRAFT_1954000 [Lactarius akahatsu]
MTEWQDAARAEAQHARTLASCLQAQGIKTSWRTGPIPITSNVVTPPTIPAADDIVPMDINAISTSKRTFQTNLSDADYTCCQKEGRCFYCQQISHLTKACPKRRRTQINDISAPLPTTQTIIRDALTLCPDECVHILNSLSLTNYGNSPEAQINNLQLASPLPTFPSHLRSSFTTPHLPIISSLNPSQPPSPPTHPRFLFTPVTLALSDDTSASACLSTVQSRSLSPTMSLHPSHPLSPAVFSSLALPDERPTSPPLANPVPFIDFLSNNGDAFLTVHPPLSPSSLIRVEDDTTLNGGVKTSMLSVSTPQTPRQPALFLSCALERPRDPDEIEQTTPHHRASPPCPDNPAPQIAIVLMKHPLYTHARKRHEREYDADDEEDHKRLAEQFAARTTPLPSFKKYRRQPTGRKYEPPKQIPSPYLKHGKKPRTTDSAEPSTFDAVLHHVLYRYRPQAKDPEHPLNPFEVNDQSTVHAF